MVEYSWVKYSYPLQLLWHFHVQKLVASYLKVMVNHTYVHKTARLCFIVLFFVHMNYTVVQRFFN